MGRLDEHDPAMISAAQRWVVRLNSGEMSDREMRRFREWTADPDHQRAFQRELTNWRKLGALRDGMASMISLPSPAEIMRRKFRRWMQGGVGAAVVAIGVCFGGPKLVLCMQADHIAGSQLAKIVLPDGSHAVLDAGTAIAVNFAGEKRTVKLLHGRAWFDVKHQAGSTFEVAVAGGRVQDIGTAFEVNLDGDHVETTVSEGRVRVIDPTSSSIELGAGQRASFGVGSPVSKERDVPIQRVASWRTGNIVLEGVNVRQAIAAVARYRSGPTWVWGTLEPTAPITVVLRSDRPDAALDALAVSEGLSLMKLPGGVVIVR